MTAHNHALVWIDHRLAKLFYLGLDAVERVTIEAHLTTEHLHHKANSIVRVRGKTIQVFSDGLKKPCAISGSHCGSWH